MKKFKTKKKKNFKISFIFLIFFFLSFFASLSYFLDPNFFLSYLNKSHFDTNTSITTWFFRNTFGTKVMSDEEEIGKVEYVPDPNPLENKDNPVVYIYNTHQTEEYYIDLLMEHDVVFSVMTASYILREKLNLLNIKSMVETSDVMKYLNSNGLSYDKSYMVSRIHLEEALKNNPTLKYFIDIHRDSISYEASTLVSSDKSYAKVLFVIGTDFDGFVLNRKFASEISDCMNKLVPGISRGILEKDGNGNNGVYNEDFNSHTILIEVGSSYNRISEVNNTMDVLAKSLDMVIRDGE